MRYKNLVPDDRLDDAIATLARKDPQSTLHRLLIELKDRRISARKRGGGRPKLDRKCSAPGCDREHHSFGYCVSHARKVKLYGSPYYDVKMHRRR